MDLPVLFQASRSLDFCVRRMTSWFQSLPKLFPLSTQDVFFLAFLLLWSMCAVVVAGWEALAQVENRSKQSVRLEYWFCFRSPFLARKIQGIASLEYVCTQIRHTKAKGETVWFDFRQHSFFSPSSGFIPLNKFNSINSWRALLLLFFFFFFIIFMPLEHLINLLRYILSADCCPLCNSSLFCALTSHRSSLWAKILTPKCSSIPQIRSKWNYYVLKLMSFIISYGKFIPRYVT